MDVYLLLLVFAFCDWSTGTQEAAEDRGVLLRVLWRKHMKDVLAGTGSGSGSSGPNRGRVTHRLLYCRVGIGFHLQILRNGSVGGVHMPSENCWLKFSVMSRGVVAIRGVRSGLYLCVNEDGWAYGAERFSDDCRLKETLEENHYNTYSSESHPGVYLALSPRGELRRGDTVTQHHVCTHFLPRRTTA
ncbi:fibroblast growth factor 4A-like [Sphaeramia orbicularis]|uniref:fibroblast growth factor 4A-like n=1 Tax=Sphaeramia orbicularis TaxID=375764 RepID=UPI00117D0DD3|nr:fibroblast growth factor 4A-like [Sphaeramia orbicularis]